MWTKAINLGIGMAAEKRGAICNKLSDEMPERGKKSADWTVYENQSGFSAKPFEKTIADCNAIQFNFFLGVPVLIVLLHVLQLVIHLVSLLILHLNTLATGISGAVFENCLGRNRKTEIKRKKFILKVIFSCRCKIVTNYRNDTKNA